MNYESVNFESENSVRDTNLTCKSCVWNGVAGNENCLSDTENINDTQCAGKIIFNFIAIFNIKQPNIKHPCQLSYSRLSGIQTRAIEINLIFKIHLGWKFVQWKKDMHDSANYFFKFIFRK